MTFSRILRDSLFEADPMMLDNQIDFEQNNADRSRYTIGHNIHPASEMDDQMDSGQGAPYDGAMMGGGGMPGGDMGAGGMPGGAPDPSQLQPIQPGMGIPGQEDQQQQQPMQQESKDDFDLYLDALLDESIEDISEGPYDFIRGAMGGGYPGMGGGFRGPPGGYQGGGYQGGNRGGYAGQPMGQPYGGQQYGGQPQGGQAFGGGRGGAGGGYTPPGPRNYAGFDGPQQPPASITAGGPAAVQNWQSQMGAVGRGVSNPMRSGIGTEPPTFGSRGQVTGRYANPGAGGGNNLKSQQADLINKGYDLGPTGADGVMGKFTRNAMQQSKANGGGANPNNPMAGIKQNAAAPGTGDREKDLTRTQGTMNTPFGANTAPAGTEFGKSAGGGNTFQPPFKPGGGGGTIPAGTDGIGVAREPVKWSDEGWGSMGNPMNMLNISRAKQPEEPPAPNSGFNGVADHDKDTTPTSIPAVRGGQPGLQQQQPPHATVTGAGAGPMSPSTAPAQQAPAQQPAPQAAAPAQTSTVKSASTEPSALNASKDWGLDWADYNILHEGDRSFERKRRGY